MHVNQMFSSNAQATTNRKRKKLEVNILFYQFAEKVKFI